MYLIILAYSTCEIPKVLIHLIFFFHRRLKIIQLTHTIRQNISTVLMTWVFRTICIWICWQLSYHLTEHFEIWYAGTLTQGNVQQVIIGVYFELDNWKLQMFFFVFFCHFHCVNKALYCCTECCIQITFFQLVNNQRNVKVAYIMANMVVWNRVNSDHVPSVSCLDFWNVRQTTYGAYAITVITSAY